MACGGAAVWPLKLHPAVRGSSAHGKPFSRSGPSGRRWRRSQQSLGKTEECRGCKFSSHTHTSPTPLRPLSTQPLHGGGGGEGGGGARHPCFHGALALHNQRQFRVFKACRYRKLGNHDKTQPADVSGVSVRAVAIAAVQLRDIRKMSAPS